MATDSTNGGAPKTFLGLPLRWGVFLAAAALVLLGVYLWRSKGPASGGVEDDQTATIENSLPAHMIAASSYPHFEFTKEDHAAVVDLRRRWQQSATAKGRLTRQVEKKSVIPVRTVCADFLEEPGKGPIPPKQLVACWADVARLCSEDLDRAGTKWWTLSTHGDPPSPSPERDGLRFLPSILRNLPGSPAMYPPDLGYVPTRFTPKDIDEILGDLPEGPVTSDSLAASDPRGRINQCERLALVKFLLLFLRLKEKDTVQFFACHLNDNVPDVPQKQPIALVDRLARLNPGVRIVVYEGIVKWDGADGAHSGSDRSVYVWVPVK